MTAEQEINNVLQNLNQSAEAINGATKVFLKHYKTSSKEAARVWHKVVMSTPSSSSQLLPLAYICNDVLQQSVMRKYGFNYLEAFWPYMGEGFARCAKVDFKRVMRIVDVLGEREIYSKKHLPVLRKEIEKGSREHSPLSQEGVGIGASSSSSSSSNGNEPLIVSGGGSGRSVTLDLNIPKVRKRKASEKVRSDEEQRTEDWSEATASAMSNISLPCFSRNFLARRIAPRPALRHPSSQDSGTIEDFDMDKLLGKKAKIEEKSWPEREKELSTKVKDFARKFKAVQNLEDAITGGVDMDLMNSEGLATVRSSSIKAADTLDKMIAVLEDCAGISAWIHREQKKTLKGVKGEKETNEKETMIVRGMIGTLEKVQELWRKSRGERTSRKKREAAAEEEARRVKRKREEEERRSKELKNLKEQEKDTEGKVWDPTTKTYRAKDTDGNDSWRDR